MKIAIDAGHGGNNPGASGISTKIVEKNYTLLIANQIEKALMEKEAIVFMTRRSDNNYSMLEREERNWTALIAAASVGKTKVVNYLIQKKAYLNLRTNLGDTALYRASAKGYSEIVKNLLEAGANPNIKDKKGDTPLMKAASKGNIEVI